MLNKVKKSNSKGFTIIEVMIVLAIAALILLIVFLAVPALQRSSRNTQRKGDVGRIGAAAQTLISNNNGTVSVAVLSTAGTEAGALSYYSAANISSADGSVATGVANPNDVTKVIVVANGKCGATASANTVPQDRQIAILYTTESGTSGKDEICVDE